MRQTFCIGDIVRVKSWDEMQNDPRNESPFDDVISIEGADFCDSEIWQCGREFEIDKTDDYWWNGNLLYWYYPNHEDGINDETDNPWGFSEAMLELIADSCVNVTAEDLSRLF